nr:MAG TPA: hypothetical protein [Caudoviricetes sp.]
MVCNCPRSVQTIAQNVAIGGRWTALSSYAYGRCKCPKLRSSYIHKEPFGALRPFPALCLHWGWYRLKRKPLHLAVRGLRFYLLVVSVRMRWSSYQTACR